MLVNGQAETEVELEMRLWALGNGPGLMGVPRLSIQQHL